MGTEHIQNGFRFGADGIYEVLPATGVVVGASTAFLDSDRRLSGGGNPQKDASELWRTTTFSQMRDMGYKAIPNLQLRG